MYYTIYKTTNLINNKFYIGQHKTNNPYDSYLGSGKLLQASIKKYGKENFKKEVLFIFDNESEMNQKEKELVTEELIKDSDCYNRHLGGYGGFSHINDGSIQHRERSKKGAKNTQGLIKYNEKIKDKNSEEYKKLCIKNKERSLKGQSILKLDRILNKEKYDLISKKISKARLTLNGMKNKCWCVPLNCLDINLEKRVFDKDNIPVGWMTIKNFKLSKKTVFGPTFDKIWINNKSTKKSKLIKNGENIPEGWIKGRK